MSNKIPLISFLFLSGVIFATTPEQIIQKDQKLVYYTDNMNATFLDKNKEQSIKVVGKMDELISEMEGFEEVHIIKKIKQDFITKYIKRESYVDEKEKNLQTILNNTRHKTVIKYETEINDKKNLLK